MLASGRGELIAARPPAGIPLAVASELRLGVGRGLPGAARALTKFVALTTIDHVAKGKPHPEPFLAACARVGARADRAGPSRTRPPGGAPPSRRACFTVACPVALTAAHDLSAADLVVDSLEEVTLAGWNASAGATSGP